MNYKEKKSVLANGDEQAHWSKLCMGSCRVAEQQPERPPKWVYNVGSLQIPSIVEPMFEISVWQFHQHLSNSLCQGQKKQCGHSWLLMSILTGKGCGVSMRLSAEFGREEGWCKDKMWMCFQSQSHASIFKRQTHSEQA